MTPEAAVLRICDAISRMNAVYGRPVFDEWALIAVSGSRGCVLGYEGPRRAEFVRQLADDSSRLLVELEAQPRQPGTFAFALDGAAGASNDAFIVAGPSVFLLCQNTKRTMLEITADIRWRQAQAAFTALAEMFRMDPTGHPSSLAVSARI